MPDTNAAPQLPRLLELYRDDLIRVINSAILTVNAPRREGAGVIASAPQAELNVDLPMLTDALVSVISYYHHQSPAQRTPAQVRERSVEIRKLFISRFWQFATEKAAPAGGPHAKN